MLSLNHVYGLLGPAALSCLFDDSKMPQEIFTHPEDQFIRMCIDASGQIAPRGSDRSLPNRRRVTDIWATVLDVLVNVPLIKG